jgi:putative ABC transport system permease protein
METLVQDLRYAFRTLTRNRGFAAVAVCSLALGIGANVTIFSFVDALMMRPPSVTDPAGLLEVWQHNPARGNGIGSHMQLSFPDYEYYRDHNRVFSEMGGFTAETSRVTWSRAGQGEILQGALVSANFFSILGVRPVLGRSFAAADDQPAAAAPVAVLSHALWQQRLGADPGVVGTSLTLNGRAVTVVGVAPPGFTGLLAGFTPDFWSPLATHPITNPGLNLTERRMHWMLGIGRLKPGVAAVQARADLAVLGNQLSTEYPDADKDLTAAAVPLELVPSPFRGALAAISAVAMGVVALVLLIACANVANLLLARASSRRREMAVRAALGADRRRLIRQTLTEGLFIAGLAGVVGLLLSSWATPFLWSLRPASLPLALNVSPDIRVLLFTAAASLLTGVAFALAPALQQSRVHHVASLKDGSRQGGSAKSRLRHALVVTQVTACLVLLVGTGLCLRSLRNAGSIDPGFDMRRAVSASLDVAAFGYDEARGKAYYAALLERVRALPGVRAASLADHLPLSSVTRMEGIEIDGYRAPGPAGGTSREIPIDCAVVAPGYFEAMATPLLRGRAFSAQDGDAAAPVVVINQQMAAQYWRGKDPVGQFVTLLGPQHSRTRAEIIGVVQTGKYRSLGEDPRPFFFRSLLQDYQPGVQLVVRAQDDLSMVRALTDTVRTLDPAIPLVGVETLEQHLQVPLFPARAAGLLLGMFGGLALTLAVVGLYGVIAYSVSQRRVEIGVRMALGARQADIVRMVVWQGLRLTLIGMGIGLAIAMAATRVLSSILYGISASDPLTFGGVTLALTAVAMLASYLPARWAARLEPIRALRAD